MNKKDKEELSKTLEADLSPESIDRCSGFVREFLTKLKFKSNEITKHTISIEEVLLKHLGLGQAKITVTVGIKFFRPVISLSISGNPHNVYAKNDEGGEFVVDNILKNIGIAPDYNYKNNTNTYIFRLKKKTLNPFFPLIIALGSAIILANLGFLLPNGTKDFINNSILTPLHDTFLNVLGCSAGPMVFLSVAWGIYGIGNVLTLKLIGKRLILSYIGIVFAVVVISCLLCLPIFPQNFVASAGVGSEITSIFTMLLNVFPKNIFSPFVDGNTLQIIFLAVVIGIAMLFLGKKTNSVAKAVEQINYIVSFLIEFIGKLVPFFIFIVVIQLIWSDVSILTRVTKLFIVTASLTVLFAIVIILINSVKTKTSPFVLTKKGLPTLLIALTTASSAAAFGTNISACKNKFGIDEKISSFGIPLGMVTFKPNTAISFLVMSLFFGQYYNLEVSTSWYILLVITVTILAVATPPIPGGALMAYTMLFTQINIPIDLISSAIAIALTCDAILDFWTTGFDQFTLPFAIMNPALRLGMLDKNITRKK